MIEAVKKLKDEMKKEKSSYVQVIGKFLLQFIEVNPTEAEKILAEGKTIKGSLDTMRKEAEKQKVGNVAVLSDQEGFSAVLKYFGIIGTVPASPLVAMAPVESKEEVKPKETSSVNFDVSLEDFL